MHKFFFRFALKHSHAFFHEFIFQIDIGSAHLIVPPSIGNLTQGGV